MKKIVLDFRNSDNKDDIHDMIESALEFPEYYGRNLDSLHDCLTDITEDVCIGIYEPDEHSEVFGYLKRINRVCEHAESENRHLCIFIFQESRTSESDM